MWFETSPGSALTKRHGAFVAAAWWISLSWTLVSALAQTNSGFPAQLAPNVFRVGVIEQAGLAESSGLAASPRYPDVFWTHNDTGYPAFLFAINSRGEHLGAFEVKNARLIDWEAVAFDEAGQLYFADLGTNGLLRSHSAIHRLEEPDPARRWGPAEVQDTWYVRYPGEREDAESFFVHNGNGYIVTKYETNRTVNLYRFDLANTAESILLEFVTTIPINGNVSDAAISADKNRLALVTNDGVTVFFINGDPASAATARRESTPFNNTSMEGGTFVPDGLLVTSEAVRDVLLFTSSTLTGAPRFVTPLTNITSFIGRTVTLAAEVFATPPVSFEWRFNRALLPGQTNAILTLTNISLADAGIYQLTASNAAGTAQSSAQLTVSEKVPDLRITEVMSSEAPGTEPTSDWWELTSFDPETNDLTGWRFNDSTGGLNDAFILPPGTTIRPGESVVFVENLTPEEFRAWWGEANVPASVQVITYSGAQLSFNAVRDSLRVWDNRATSDAAVAARADFGAADIGVSFIPDPATGQLSAKSQVGVNGAFRAVSGPDAGSPGRFLTNTIAAVRLEGHLQGNSVRLTGSRSMTTYLLEYSEDLSSGDWKMVEATPVENSVSLPPSEPQRFYRLRER